MTHRMKNPGLKHLKFEFIYIYYITFGNLVMESRDFNLADPDLNTLNNKDSEENPHSKYHIIWYKMSDHNDQKSIRSEPDALGSSVWI